ncbi:hypothetical protein F5Y16DRAFT_419090 [Xylariaceae sp. FL0255]|nr:hypothetical protein F5Y16DRAFT_419090 [Xylariaceae sp. FL0255]
METTSLSRILHHYLEFFGLLPERSEAAGVPPNFCYAIRQICESCHRKAKDILDLIATEYAPLVAMSDRQNFELQVLEAHENNLKSMLEYWESPFGMNKIKDDHQILTDFNHLGTNMPMVNNSLHPDDHIRFAEAGKVTRRLLWLREEYGNECNKHHCQYIIECESLTMIIIPRFSSRSSGRG